MRHLLASIVVCTNLLGSFAADPPPISQLIQNLGDRQFRVRDAASRELWNRGLAARPALLTARLSDDPEVVRRADDILTKFDWHILPQTPAAVVQAIREYRSNEYDRQTAAINTLFKQNETGLEALTACLRHDFGPERQQVLLEHVLVETRRSVPVLLLDQKSQLVERVLELGLESKNPEAWLDYANYMTQRGRGAAALAKLEQLRTVNGATREHATLASIMVQHLSGQSPAAIRLAQQHITGTQGRELANSLLSDAGKWSDLIDADGSEDAPRSFGLDLYHLRKAGQYDKAATLVKTAKDDNAGGLVTSASETGLSLLLNEQPLEGLAYLRAKKAEPHLVVDLLAGRLQFDEAFKITADTRERSDDDDGRFNVQLAIRQARLRAQLGEREEAVRQFRSIAQNLRASSAYQMRELLRAEIRVGQIALAVAHAGRFMGEFEKNSRSFHTNPDLFEVLFDEDTEAARGWWIALYKSDVTKDEPPEEIMQRVYELVTGRAAPERIVEARAAMKQTQERLAKYLSMSFQRIRTQRALAQLARHSGDDAAYERHLRSAIELSMNTPVDDSDGIASGPREWVYGVNESIKLWLELGEWLMDHARHAEALQVYEQGWRRYPDNPIPLYFSGRALLAAGQKAEGQRRIDLAQVVSVGNAQMRGRFLDELCNSGQLADARKARDLALRSVWYWNKMRGNVWNQIARASSVVKDFAIAADATDRNLHFLLKTPGIVFVEGTGYLQVPMSIRTNRVRAALAANQLAGQAEEVRKILEIVPGHVEFITQVVPEFERLGAAADADAIFRQIWTSYQRVLEQHPNSAWAASSAAMLAAGCRRELDPALKLAKSAVEREPDWKIAKEVLAEVHFRRSEREAASAVMSELSRREWRNAFYKRQLVRFERGDVKSPLPVGPEED